MHRRTGYRWCWWLRNAALSYEMERQLENARKELLTKTAEEYRDSKSARTRLMNGLSQLAQHAQQLANQDASDLVQRFGQMGHRKFHLAA